MLRQDVAVAAPLFLFGSMFEKIIASKYLYPLWRIGWLERAFFHACRLFYTVRPSAFLSLNFGFDISKYQGIVDFLKMLAFGARFLILRCAYNITKDERFEEYIAAAYRVLPLSTYHFYDPVFDPAQQARQVIAILEPHKHKIRRVWLDLEFWWSGAFSHPKHWKVYRDTIKAAGYRVGWYTRATWWDSRVGEYAAEFAKDPVWAAQYNAVLNLIPKGWTKAAIWQDKTPAIGELAGVSSLDIDHNLWNDEFNFVQEWGVSTETPVEPPPEPPTGGTMKGTVTNAVTRSLNVRSSITGQVIAALKYDFTLNKGDVVYGEVRADGRIYFNKIYRADGTIQTLPELASAITRDGTTTWMTLTNEEEPGTTPAPEPDPVSRTPFTFQMEGFKPYTGELEKE